MAEALLLGDRIAVLHAGRLVQVGTPAELLRAPADERVAELLRDAAAPGRGARRAARPRDGAIRSELQEQLALLPGYLSAHLQLSLVALGAGALLAIPLGVAVHRRRALERRVLGAASVDPDHPGSRAARGDGAAVRGARRARRARGTSAARIGYLPALVALTLYGLLPILRNTVTGLAGVDPAVREAARGVGMTPPRELLPRRAAARAAGDRRGRAHGGGVGRGHRDALDADRRDEPRQLHLQRARDAQRRRGAASAASPRPRSRSASTS